MAEKTWGGEPFWGLGYEWDPEWVLTDRQKELRDTLIELCEKAGAHAKLSIIHVNAWFGDFDKKAGPVEFFGGTPPRRYRLINANGVNLDIRFAHQVLDFTLRVPAAVVSSVRDDQKRFSRITRLLHLMHSEVNAIEQRCPALRRR